MSTIVTLYLVTGAATSDNTKTPMDSACSPQPGDGNGQCHQSVATFCPAARAAVADESSWDGCWPDQIARFATEQERDAYRVPSIQWMPLLRKLSAMSAADHRPEARHCACGAALSHTRGDRDRGPPLDELRPMRENGQGPTYVTTGEKTACNVRGEIDEWKAAHRSSMSIHS